MGWNDVEPVSNACLFRGIIEPRFYFLHSYYMSPANPENILSTTDYQGRFTSSVRHKNIIGTQFHPEKSHHWGVQLLKRFAEL
jgi:glutamine amidotransferase